MRSKIGAFPPYDVLVKLECKHCNGIGTVIDIKTGHAFRCRKCNAHKGKTLPKKERTKAERSKLTKSLRFEVLEKYNFKCRACGYGANDGKKLHVDHIIPVSKDGKTEIANLQVLCSDCNVGKGTKIVDGWVVEARPMLVQPVTSEDTVVAWRHDRANQADSGMADVNTSEGGEFDN